MLRLLLRQRYQTTQLCRHFSAPPPPNEASIKKKLEESLKVENISVQDISGGCGAMFQIYVQSEDFNGLRTLQQHKLIKNILKEDVANMHGLTIKTEPTNR
ncbi:hypothetical protein ACHWQZ_G017955 [Mnemiopsis leidyi]